MPLPIREKEPGCYEFPPCFQWDFYARAILNRPEYLEARLNLAGVLQKEGKGDEAMAQYREVLRLKSDHWQASYKLGIELARRGKYSEAEGHFAQVVQLRPDYASGHFNLGVVLAQEKRMEQAIFHFREALRHDLSNQTARQYLEQAQLLNKPVP